MSENSHADDRRQRRRKVAAILAGGLVVGVGTAATLASWNDSEYATGTFTAGTFKMIGAVDAAQSTFSEHQTAGAAGALAFTSNFSNLTPTDVIYAPYALRLDKSSTYAANVVVAISGTTGTVTNLTYQLFTTAAAGCSSSSTVATTIVAAGTAVSSVGTPTSFALAKPVTVGTTDGTPAYLCFKVTAGSITQAQTGSVTWAFTGTSS